MIDKIIKALMILNYPVWVMVLIHLYPQVELAYSIFVFSLMWLITCLWYRTNKDRNKIRGLENTNAMKDKRIDELIHKLDKDGKTTKLEITKVFEDKRCVLFS